MKQGLLSGLDEAVAWLEAKSNELIRGSRRETTSGIAAFAPQAGSGYEAFWLRDYAYMLEGNIAAFSDKELRDAYLFFVDAQREDGAAPDCVRFDGTPIYMPGLGTLGRNPVADGSQFLVDVAWHTYQRTHDSELIESTIGRLVKAMNAVPRSIVCNSTRLASQGILSLSKDAVRAVTNDAPYAVPRNPDTHLVHIKPGADLDRCGYGFTDTVVKHGDELFCSLLFVQAGGQLADLFGVIHRKEEAQHWRDEADVVAENVRNVFWDAEIGLFRAATVQCREPDIWGSAFAVFTGVATESQSPTIAEYFRDHYNEIAKRGQLRHIPGGMYWEVAREQEKYQNGAYWAAPVGWFVYTLDLLEPDLADRTVVDMVQDFIDTGDVNECVNDGYANVSRYVVSATLPLDGIRIMMRRRRSWQLA